MGQALAIAGGLAATTCVEAPTEPSPAPRLEGNYVLVVQASTVCALPTQRFQWVVESRTVGEGVGADVRVTLPPGDDAIDLNLTYTVDPASRDSLPTADRVTGTLTSLRAKFGASLEVTIQGQAQGVVTDAGGRGEVESGTFNGTISLSDQPEEEDRTNDNLGSCTAADHVWGLLAG